MALLKKAVNFCGATWSLYFHDYHDLSLCGLWQSLHLCSSGTTSQHKGCTGFIAAGMDSYISIKQVCKTYGRGASASTVLNKLDLEVAQGERVALVGQSGCGKSTLMNVIAGIDTIDSGTISIAGKQMSGLTETARTLHRREHIGFVYQSFNLIPSLTASENVQLPLQLNKHSTDSAISHATQMLEQVGLADRLDAFPDQLSGGEQQRVAIARAMVHKPALVLADEHTGNLDAETGKQMMDLFTELARTNAQTVLMVTHSLGVASTADRVLQLVDGKLATYELSGEATLAW